MLKAYENYKSSISPFKRDIPAHWDEHKVSWIFSFKSIQNNIGEELLSVFLNKGVVSYSSTSQKQVHKPSDDLSKYQLVEIGDFVLNNQQAWRGSVGVSKYRGIISPAYYVLEPRINIHSDFLNYLVRDRDVVDQFVLASKGVGSIQRQIYVPYLKSVILALPPREEQDQIVRFLNWKTSEMAHFIHEKKKEIRRLEELKKSIVNQAVTKGLNPTVTMQKTGIDWLPQIPAHWEKCSLRQFLVAKSKKNYPDMPLLSVTRELGVIVRDVDDSESNHNYIPDDLNGYKLVKNGQFVINKMKAWQGSYGVSKHDGIVSPAYFVFDLNFKNKDYFHFAIRSRVYVNFFAQYSDGIRTGQWDLSIQKLKSIPFFVPPLEEQNEILSSVPSKIEDINQLISSLKKEIALVQELRTKTISDIVTGKVDVRGVIVPDYVPEEDEVDLDEELNESEEDIKEEDDD